MKRLMEPLYVVDLEVRITQKRRGKQSVTSAGVSSIKIWDCLSVLEIDEKDKVR